MTDMRDAEMVDTLICERWTLKLPKYRAERGETWSVPGGWWPYWERPRLDSMFYNLHRGDVIYDIGAEEGDWPALWALWGCDVFMAEPNPRVWPNIRAIFNANELAEHNLGSFVGFAAENTTDEYPLMQRAGQWPDCAYGELIGDHGFSNLWERPDIPRITIDRISEELGRPPTAITMDTEGSEFEVLKGAERTLVEDRPLVWVSIHPWMLFDNYHHMVDDLVNWMAARGYAREHLASEHEFHTLFYPTERDNVVLPYGNCP